MQWKEIRSGLSLSRIIIFVVAVHVVVVVFVVVVCNGTFNPTPPHPRSHPKLRSLSFVLLSSFSYPLIRPAVWPAGASRRRAAGTLCSCWSTSASSGAGGQPQAGPPGLLISNPARPCPGPGSGTASWARHACEHAAVPPLHRLCCCGRERLGAAAREQLDPAAPRLRPRLCAIVRMLACACT